LPAGHVGQGSALPRASKQVHSIIKQDKNACLRLLNGKPCFMTFLQQRRKIEFQGLGIANQA
jgi:hypothetical protein